MSWSHNRTKASDLEVQVQALPRDYGLFFMKLLIAVLTAFHFSALGDYLVDQDGQRVVPKGGLQVICTQNQGTNRISGVLQKARGAKIWIVSPSEGNGPDWYVEISKPICDVIR